MRHEKDQAHELTSALIRRLGVQLKIADAVVPPSEGHPVLDELALYNATYKHAYDYFNSHDS